MSDPRSIARHEDGPLVTGAARFVGDVRLPAAVSLLVLRSPVAHGVIHHIDVTRARNAPGVAAVWTAADVVADLGAVPLIPPRMAFEETMRPYFQPVLASHRVRYVGEPLAIVVAQDRYVAEDAAELVRLDIEALPAVTDCTTSQAQAALFSDGNRITSLYAHFGSPDEVFREAPVVVEAQFDIGRQTAVALETRGLLADYAPAQDMLTVYGAAKVAHANRDLLAHQLRMNAEHVVMRETAVGGGFGVRGEYYPEDFLVAWACRKLRRPVQWIEDRRENLIAANHSRQQHHHAAIAGTPDGRILGLRTECWVDSGAYLRTVGLRVPDLTLHMLPGPYDIAAYSAAAHCMVTNKTPTGTYRAPGRFESAFVRERLVDLFAHRIGAPPLDVRRLNLVTPAQMPYSRTDTSSGETWAFREGDYSSTLGRIARAVGDTAVADRRRAGEAVGVGVAAFMEKSGLGPWEFGSISVLADGRLSVRTGCGSVGQGIRTVLAQIVAEALDMDTSLVQVEMVDTAVTAHGVGTYASRSTATAGSAVHLAARSLAVKARVLAAPVLGASPEDLAVSGGAVTRKADPVASVSLSDLAASSAGGLTAEAFFNAGELAYTCGAVGALASVDRDTGQARVERLVVAFDVGHAINPKLVKGQLVGAAVQALGGTLFEQLQYGDDGTPLRTSFAEYLIPALRDAPEVQAIVEENAPTSTNPIGVKGVGEAGVPGVAAAVAAAIDDAVGRPGLVHQTPITPELVLAALAKERTAP